MPDPGTAADRIQRLLYILPAASGEEGVRLDDLAEALDVSVSTVVHDITEAMGRSFYHPAGSAEDIQIHLGPERVQIWTGGDFRRPVRLAPLEALCLAMGLRGMRLEEAGGAGGDGAGNDTLLRSIEAYLATGGVQDADHFLASDLLPDPHRIREELVEAAKGRERCRIPYLKPGAEAPEERTIHPYVVAHAEGRWYCVARCERAEDVRVFRLDRVLSVERTGDRFEPPEGGEGEGQGDAWLEQFLQGGRVYVGDGDRETEARVRYSPRIARWLAERNPGGESRDDGSLVLTHRVADPDWLVRHVLAYAPDAEVLEPEEVRRRVGGGVGGGAR